MAARKPKGETSRVSVTIDQADREILQRIADEQDRSVSWVAQAIHLFVADIKRGTATAATFGQKLAGR